MGISLSHALEVGSPWQKLGPGVIRNFHFVQFPAATNFIISKSNDNTIAEDNILLFVLNI